MKIDVTKDQKLEQAIRSALERNDGYCPCKIDKNPDTKCMCKEFLENGVLGACHCGLYVKVEL